VFTSSLNPSVAVRPLLNHRSLSIDIGRRAKKPTLTDSLDDLLAPGWIHADGSNTQSDLMLSTSAHVTGLWVGGPNEVHVSAESNPLGIDDRRAVRRRPWWGC